MIARNSTTHLEWVCAGLRCNPGATWGARASSLVMALSAAAAPVRVTLERWIRYRIPLSELPPCPGYVQLVQADRTLIERLREPPEEAHNSYESALRFFNAGFGTPFAWVENGEPLSLQWLIEPAQMAGRAGLEEWAGMYPPVAQGQGYLEGLYTFRRGMRRRGGAATDLALAVCHQARQQGMDELLTHVYVSNTAAHRWAARVGLRACGEIRRYSLDLRGFRGYYVYVHERESAG